MIGTLLATKGNISVFSTEFGSPKMYFETILRCIGLVTEFACFIHFLSISSIWTYCFKCIIGI